MPARIELPVAFHHRSPRPFLQLLDLLQGLLQLGFGADDPHQVLHALLEALVHRIRILAAFPAERLKGPGGPRLDLRLVHVHENPELIRVLSEKHELEGGTVLPGFRLPLASFFAANRLS